MRKILLLLLLPFAAFSQAPTNSTTQITGSSAFTPNGYRYKDSMQVQAYNTTLQKYFQLVTGKQFNTFTGTKTKAQIDSLGQLVAGLLPGVTSGQMIVGDGAGGYRAINRIDTGIYVNTAGELAAALDIPTPTQGQIFQTWQRFAHGGRTGSPGNQGLNDTIPSLPSQTQSWSVDTLTGVINSTFNSGPSIGFTSPIKYTAYTLKTTLKSTDIDNDRVGVILAYINDPNDMVRNNAYGLNPTLYPGINTTDINIPNQHTVTMYLNRESGRPYYAIWYDYGKLSQKLIVDGSSLPGLYTPTSGWQFATTGVDVKVERRGDSIYVTRTQFSDAPGGKGAIGFQLAISLTQDPVLYKFRGGAAYGFACNSQALSSFSLEFTGGSAGTIYDLANNDVYIPNGVGGYELDTTTTAKEAVANGQIVYNPNTNKLWFKQDNFLEIKPTEQYALKTSVDSLKNALVFNVKDFGAKGDGLTNDLPSFKAAENAAHNAGGGIVYAPQGSYLWRRPLPQVIEPMMFLRSNITLAGAGMGATKIINDPTTPADTTGWKTGNNIAIISIGKRDSSVTNVSVHDLHLIGNSSIINANRDSISDFLGIEARFQIDNLADTTKLKKLHADNVHIYNVAVTDVLRGIGAGKSILGYRYADYLSTSDTSIVYNDKWKLENFTINGIFNRSIEFSFTNNITITNPTIYGAGFLHLLSGVKNVTINNPNILFGGDLLSNDRQGHKITDPKSAAGIYINHGVENVTVIGGYVRASPLIDPTTPIGGGILLRAEPPAAKTFSYSKNIKFIGGIYEDLYTAGKRALQTYYVSYKLGADSVSFINTVFKGHVGVSTGALSKFSRWVFNGATIDSLTIPATASTAGSYGFTLLNTSVAKNFIAASDSVILVGSKFKGLTLTSAAVNTIIDNSTYSAITIQNSALPLFKNMPFLINTATDATYSTRYANQIVNLGTITANRSISLSLIGGAIYKGQSVIYRNGNTSGTFSWSFPASTVKFPNGTFVTTLRNNATYRITPNGDATFNIESITDGTVSGTGIPVFTNSPTFTGTVTTPALAITSVAAGTAGTDSLLVKSSTTNLIRKIAPSFYAITTRNLIAGLGLSGGGTLSADRTFTADTTYIRTVLNSWSKAQADIRYLQKTGGTMSGNIAMGNNSITGVNTVSLNTANYYWQSAIFSHGRYIVDVSGSNNIDNRYYASNGVQYNLRFYGANGLHNWTFEPLAGTGPWAKIDSTGTTSPSFKPTPTSSPTYEAGKLVYDTSNESLTFYNNDANVSLQIGQESWIRVRNNSGSTITNGAAVYINGSSSGLPTIALAKADVAATTVSNGIATESIANGAIGYVTSLGVVNGLNTSGFSVGPVYLSNTTAGALTQTVPTTLGQYRYRIGYVTVVDATVGKIHIQTGTAIRVNFVENATTVGLSAATLNATYPSAQPDDEVSCPSILLGGAIYKKYSAGWQTISAPPTP